MYLVVGAPGFFSEELLLAGYKLLEGREVILFFLLVTVKQILFVKKIQDKNYVLIHWDFCPCVGLDLIFFRCRHKIFKVK